MNPDRFGINLLSLLEDLRMTQAELAKRSGLTQACISQIINKEREPTLKTIIKILEVIPTTFERLIE